MWQNQGKTYPLYLITLMRAIGFIHQGFSYVSISDKEKYTKKMRREKKKLIIKNAAYSCFDRLLASTTMISFLSLIYWFQRKKGAEQAVQ